MSTLLERVLRSPYVFASLACVLLVALACVVVFAHARLARIAPPSAALTAWALSTLEAAHEGRALPEAPKQEHRGAGPAIALAWYRGEVIARHVGEESLVASVRAAARAFVKDAALETLRGVRVGDPAHQVRFTLTLTGERARWVRAVPFLAELGVVPLVEGVRVEHRGKHAYATPDEITAAGLWDRAIDPRLPDLTFGLSPVGVAGLLARQLEAEPSALLAEARFERFAALTLARDRYPRAEPVTIESLERAAREGVEFLVRHQSRSGRYTYRYDAHRNRPAKSSAYSLPRHGGTTFFLAQAARVLESSTARAGALRALGWIRKRARKQCGDHPCVGQNDLPDMGSSALVALAAAETLRSGDDPHVRELLTGLTGFIRAMQRPDGELMHVYDVVNDRPIDVQKMYFSGEAAFALLASHSATGDARDLEAAKPLMRHLTGAGWSFFGSRYFYGEEHWTCQAVAAAADRIPDPSALDFCLRWLEFQRALLYGPGETPWPMDGAIGVGPVLIPRVTPVASRVESGALIYPVALARGHDVRALRDQMQRSVGLLLRMRWAPGPAHLFLDPGAALGGFPATQASLEARNDFVQHAGSAMLSWLEQLRRERAHATAQHTEASR